MREKKHNGDKPVKHNHDTQKEKNQRFRPLLVSLKKTAAILNSQLHGFQPSEQSEKYEHVGVVAFSRVQSLELAMNFHLEFFCFYFSTNCRIAIELV